MYGDFRCLEAVDSNGLLNPDQHVTARTALLITQIVIEREMHYLAGFQRGKCFVWPEDKNPAIGGWAEVAR